MSGRQVGQESGIEEETLEGSEQASLLGEDWQNSFMSEIRECWRIRNHGQWVVMQAVSWRLEENKVAAVRGRGNGESIYFITVLLNLLHLA